MRLAIGIGSFAAVARSVGAIALKLAQIYILNLVQHQSLQLPAGLGGQS
jgi:hypothetical protein